MRKDEYIVKYKAPRQWFWRKVIAIGDGVEAHFRFIRLSDDSLLYIPLESLVLFDSNRQVVIQKNMSKESGQNISGN